MSQQRRMPPVGRAYRQIHALGQAPVFAPQVPTAPAPIPQDAYDSQDPNDYTYIPAFYTASIIIGGTVDSRNGGSVALRPERFELRRITFSTTADLLPTESGLPFLGSSIDARAIEISWGDEFVNFLGSTPTLVASLFGDSQGFLDLPRPILFQGRQTLNVQLHRIAWPWSALPVEQVNTRWDFTFQGVGILPKNVQISGSL